MPADLEALRERFGQHFEPGASVFVEDESGTDLFVVLTGSVAFDVHDGAGQSHRLPRTAGPGEVFGEMSCFSDETRSATAVALTETVALRLSREAALEIVRASPVFGLRIIHTLAGRLRDRLSEEGEESSSPPVTPPRRPS